MAKQIEEMGVECEDFKAYVAEEKPAHVDTPKVEYYLAGYSAPAKAVVIGLALVVVWAAAEFVLSAI